MKKFNVPQPNLSQPLSLRDFFQGGPLAILFLAILLAYASSLERKLLFPWNPKGSTKKESSPSLLIDTLPKTSLFQTFKSDFYTFNLEAKMKL